MGRRLNKELFNCAYAIYLDINIYSALVLAASHSYMFLCDWQVMRDAKDGITSLAVTDHEIVTGSIDCKVRRYDIRANRLFSDFIGGIKLLKKSV
jgi:hypothetical protein